MIQIDGYSHEWEREMRYLSGSDSQQTPVDVCVRCGLQRRTVEDSNRRQVWVYRDSNRGNWLTAAPTCKGRS